MLKNKITLKLFFLASLVYSFFSCGDNIQEDPLQQAKRDEIIIQEYVTNKNLTTKRTRLGSYYYKTIENPSGVAIEAGDTVSVNYVGNVLYGNRFDASIEGNPFNTPVMPGLIIDGWVDALLTLRKGERGIYIMPSVICYRKSGSGDIPANAILVFDIEVVSVIKRKK